jgi:hypothetical protein
MVEDEYSSMWGELKKHKKNWYMHIILLCFIHETAIIDEISMKLSQHKRVSRESNFHIFPSEKLTIGSTEKIDNMSNLI